MTGQISDLYRTARRTSYSASKYTPNPCSQMRRQHDYSAPGQNQRPRPGRRRQDALTTTWTGCWIVALLTLLTLSSQVEASSRGFGRRSSYGRFVEAGEIHFDRSPPPPRIDLLRREGGGDLFETKSDGAAASTAIVAMATSMTMPDFSSPATAVASTATGLGSIVAPAGDATSSASPSQTSIVSEGGGETSLPKAFDGGLGSNYTEASCPLFLNSFLNNDTFTDCMPFGLLLQVSPVP